MSTEQSQRTMDRYFDLMRRSADFGECYTPDVTWLVAETGEIVRGADSVRDHVIALHSTMVDAHTHTYVVGEDHVYLEGDCAADAPAVGARTSYCVAYDMQGAMISAMRCYGLGARSTG
ncbi:MAG: nuclear transport factor 2 family protein [Microbacterium sp.]